MNELRIPTDAEEQETERLHQRALDRFFVKLDRDDRTREQRETIIDAAVRHLDSVAKLCREKRGKVIPFPERVSE